MRFLECLKTLVIIKAIPMLDATKPRMLFVRKLATQVPASEGCEVNRSLPEVLSENLKVMLVLRQIAFLGGNCATLPLRIGTEPFESGFIEKEMECLRQLVERSGTMI